jgi:hypothetical protein
MTTIAEHDLRERDDGTVTVAVSVDRTGLFSRLVGVLFGGRTPSLPRHGRQRAQARQRAVVGRE